MAVIRSFRELEVYKLALVQAEKIFSITKEFPKEEMFALSNQIRRSSRAVSALLAESWARRPYPAAFVNEIDEALGETMETQAWLDHAHVCDYISAVQHRELDAAWQHIGAMLTNMMRRADEFCKSASRSR